MTRDVVDNSATLAFLPARLTQHLFTGFVQDETWRDIQLHPKSGSTDTSQELQEGDSPHHQVYLKSRMDLPHGLQFDVSYRFVDTLPHQQIPSYSALDARLAWQLNETWELAVVGHNLLDPQHPEFGTPANRNEIERSVYGKVTCRF